MANILIQAVVGYAINSLVQAMQPAQEGPRLKDLKVQTSTYGNAIPIVYGAGRMAGNMIWSLPIKETKHQQGGKGNGPKVNTYSYSQTFAVAVCEGPIAGIRKIWANGELIYNVDVTADLQTLMANSQGAGIIQTALTGASTGAGIIIYLGTETQMPDPTIQASVGVGNTPAYRGTVYVVFNDLQLEPYGNRTPNIEFEVMSTATVTGTKMVARTANTGLTFNSGGIGYPFISGIQNGVLRVCDITVNTLTAYLFDASGNYIGSEFRQSSDMFPPWPAGANPSPPIPIGYMSGYPIVVNAGPGTNGAGFVSVPPCGSGVILVGDSSTAGVHIGYDLTGVLPSSEYLAGCCISADKERLLVLTAASSGGAATKWYQLSFDGTASAIQASGTIGTGVIGGAISGTANPYGASYMAMEEDYTHVWFVYGGFPSTTWLELFEIGSNGVMNQVGSWNTTNNPDVLWLGYGGSIYAKGGMLFIVVGSTLQAITRTGTLSANSPTLASVVTDIVTRTKPLQASDIDVSQLTADTVDGYIIPSRMSGRQDIEPLQQMYYFDVVESDGLLKFVKRGGAPVVVIPEDDLAAHVYGQQMPDQALVTRQQEVELPREVSVGYMAKDSAYQAGVQYSRRLVTSSQLAVTMTYYAALSDAKAKQIADVLSYSLWTARNKLQFTTGRKYAWLEPTDVVQVVKGGITYTLRLTNNDNAAGILTWEGEGEDSTIYSQNAVAAATPAQPVTISMAGPTSLQLLDIPLLRDIDDGPGFYVAGCGFLPGWKGAQPYKSVDNGASWNEVGAPILNAATIGTASTVLGSFTGGNVFDESNTVTVKLFGGSLSSSVLLNVLNGANAALIGNELVQFRDATLIAANTYVLSGLLRGRKGTEWAMTGHAAGERFILLAPNTVYRDSDGTAEIGLSRLFKGVSFGTYLADAGNISFTDTGAGLKPLSPVHVGGGRDASGNLTINWQRRTRIGAEWRDYVDASLGETTESYDLEIWNAGYGALIRTFAGLTTPTASYTSAQQVTDFGSNQATVAVKIYQNSSTVGRGYPASATV